MYSINDFARMMQDQVRMGAYLAALGRAVRPGCSVLDIGTGTGVFALAACRLGAGKVYAVEPLDAIHAARQIAADNGLGERIEFIRASSFDIRLPVPVDLIVSDMRGTLPLFGDHIPAIIDARRRLLAHGGTLIPSRDRLWAAPVTLPDWYAETVDAFAAAPLDLNLATMRTAAVNSTHRLSFGGDALLGEPRCWADLDYARIEAADVRADLDWTLDAGGRVHGIGLWFETDLDGQSGFSTGPGGPKAIYGRLVLPLAEPLRLAPGDGIEVALQARLVGGDYLWLWDTQVRPSGDHAQPRVRLRQSSLKGQLFSLDQLRVQADDYAPTLDSQGELAGLVLSLMTGEHSLRDIARQAALHLPDRFPRPEDALGLVKALAAQYGR